MAAYGALDPEKTIMMVCDMQERFQPSIAHFDEIVDNTEALLKTANILKVPVIVTEQYPKGLGATIPQLRNQLGNVEAVPKTKFTMLVPDVLSKLETLKEERGVETIVLCGIETHVCIIATCIDLVQRNFIVHVICDGCSSRRQVDRVFALQRMAKLDKCFINTTESVILTWVGDAKHPDFRQIQAIVKQLKSQAGLTSDKSML